MKHGPIPQKKNVIMLTPEFRMKLLKELKTLEEDILIIKKNILEQSDDLLTIYNRIVVIHSSIRNLDGLVEL